MNVVECEHEWEYANFTDDYRYVTYTISCARCGYELTGEQIVAALNSKRLVLRLVEEEQ